MVVEHRYTQGCLAASFHHFIISPVCLPMICFVRQVCEDVSTTFACLKCSGVTTLSGRRLNKLILNKMSNAEDDEDVESPSVSVTNDIRKSDESIPLWRSGTDPASDMRRSQIDKFRKGARGRALHSAAGGQESGDDSPPKSPPKINRLNVYKSPPKIRKSSKNNQTKCSSWFGKP